MSTMVLLLTRDSDRVRHGHAFPRRHRHPSSIYSRPFMCDVLILRIQGLGSCDVLMAWRTVPMYCMAALVSKRHVNFTTEEVCREMKGCQTNRCSGSEKEHIPGQSGHMAVGQNDSTSHSVVDEQPTTRF